MITIAIFIPSLAGGGAERVAVILSNELSELGCNIHLIVATDAPASYEKQIRDSVTLHQIGANRTASCIPGLTKLLRLEKPDVLLAIMDYASIIARLALALSGRRKKTRFYVREAVSLQYKQDEFPGTLGKLKVACKETLIGVVYRDADRVIAPANALVKAIQTKYRLSDSVIHLNNPVIGREFEQSKLAEIDALPWRGKHKFIVSAGRLSKQKDFLTLLRAFKLVRQRHDCKLIILGEGPERANLEKYIAEHYLNEHCFLPGFVENPLPYFRKASVFVLSSKFEGSPNALIQALACGTSVVATDCPTGPNEILKNDHYGKLVPIGDSSLMSAAIIDLLERTSESMAVEISNTTKCTYNSRNIASEYLAVFSQIVR